MLPLLAQAQTNDTSRIIDAIARTPLSKIIFLVLALTVVRLALAPYLRSVPVHRRSGLYGAARFVNEMLDAIVYAAVFVFLLIRPFGVQMFQIPTGSMLQTLQIHDFIVANKAVYRYSDPQVGDIVVFRPPRGAIQEIAAIDPDGQVNQDFIKRCVGAPGDIVEVKDGALYRNGKRIEEPFLNDPPIRGCYKLVHYTGPYKGFKDQYVPVSTNASDAFEPDSLPNFSHGSQTSFDYGVAIAREFTQDGRRFPEYKLMQELSPEEIQVIADLRDAPPAAVPPGHFLMMGDNRNGSHDGRFWGLVPKSAIIGRAEAIMWPFARWRRLR